MFFNVFEANGQEWLTTDFLLDQEEVEERSERKVRPPWSGYFFANAGLNEERSWDDYRKYRFIAAGNGEFYSKRLDQLSVGDEVFVFDEGNGYIGYGLVTTEKTPAAEFPTPDGPLLEQPLLGQNLGHDADNPELAEYVVGIDWKKTFDRNQGKWFRGAFANQNIVCKLRDQATVDFLKTNSRWTIAHLDVSKPTHPVAVKRALVLPKMTPSAIREPSTRRDWAYLTEIIEEFGSGGSLPPIPTPTGYTLQAPVVLSASGGIGMQFA